MIIINKDVDFNFNLLDFCGLFHHFIFILNIEQIELLASQGLVAKYIAAYNAGGFDSRLRQKLVQFYKFYQFFANCRPQFFARTIYSNVTMGTLAPDPSFALGRVRCVTNVM